MNAQQLLFRTDAREDWRYNERREQHADPRAKCQAPAQRIDEQPQIAGVADDTIDTAFGAERKCLARVALGSYPRHCGKHMRSAGRPARSRGCKSLTMKE